MKNTPFSRKILIILAIVLFIVFLYNTPQGKENLPLNKGNNINEKNLRVEPEIIVSKKIIESPVETCSKLCNQDQIPLNIKDPRNRHMYVATSLYEPKFQFMVHDVNIDTAMSTQLQAYGVWERGVCDLIYNKIQHMKDYGNVFIDIGANLGWYSMLAANLGFEVYAFEALQFNSEVFRLSLRMNPAISNRVKLIERAVVEDKEKIGKEVCLEAFAIPELNQGNGRMNEKSECKGISAELVKMTTMDHEILSEIDGVKKYPLAIKLDIEGYELPAIRSSQIFVKTPPCFIFYETMHSPSAGYSLQDWDEFFALRGYHFCKNTQSTDLLVIHETCFDLKDQVECTATIPLEKSKPRAFKKNNEII